MARICKAAKDFMYQKFVSLDEILVLMQKSNAAKRKYTSLYFTTYSQY
jgi:hypothetical protein